jgi:CheY-like chemotaxis protein
LTAFGYRVAVAASGPDAIELYESGQERPAILVTDLVMPRMSGRELADELMRRQPDLRVLFISGYSSDAVMRRQVAEEGRAFLQKPFTPVGLARKIRELLDTAPT